MKRLIVTVTVLVAFTSSSSIAAGDEPNSTELARKLMSAFERHAAAFDACADVAESSVTMTVSFDISPEGMVDSVSVTSSDDAPRAIACVEKTYSGLTFPELDLDEPLPVSRYHRLTKPTPFDAIDLFE